MNGQHKAPQYRDYKKNKVDQIVYSVKQSSFSPKHSILDNSLFFTKMAGMAVHGMRNMDIYSLRTILWLGH